MNTTPPRAYLAAHSPSGPGRRRDPPRPRAQIQNRYRIVLDGFTSGCRDLPKLAHIAAVRKIYPASATTWTRTGARP
jgi:hypothetical protein